MRRAFYKLSVVALTILSTVVTSLGASEWRRVSSANFEVTGDAPEADLIKAARRLEQFRAAVTGLFPGLEFSSPAPTVVVVYATRAGYERVKPVDWSVGLFQGGDTTNYIALSADRGEREFFATVYHEYTHYLTDNALGRSNVPPWLNEGLAEYYERTEFAGESATLGGVNAGHLALLRREGFLPGPTLFGTDYYSLQKQTKETAQRFYAESWLLVHYLVHGGRIRLPDVVAKLRSGASSRTAIGMSETELNAELQKYLRRPTFATAVGTKSPLSSADLVSVVVPPAAALAIEGDLLARLGRLNEAEARLDSALAIDPAEPLANMALGLLLVKRERVVEARVFLERAVKSVPGDYRPYFALAYALSRSGMTEFGFVVSYTPDDAAAIYENTRKAIALKPDFAESYNVFALVCAVRAERLAEGIEMIDRALAIAPGHQSYLLRRAELLMRREEFADARYIAGRVLMTASTEQLKLYAQNTVRTIDALDAAKRAEAEENKADNDALSDVPLSEEEIARRREKALLEALNQTLRPPRAGEKRILGRVVAVNCEAGRVSLDVRGELGVAEYRTTSLESVSLISYAPDFVNRSIGCGARPGENLAVVTFRARGASGGELVALEFVPAGFRFLP